jgi:SAM-dependent methyltransferase
MSSDVQAHYRTLIQTHGDTHEAAQYSSRESQEARFRVLTEIANLEGAKIMDFGCGTAHLATYLKEKGVRCDYVGIDFVTEFFDFARGKHPEHRFGIWSDFDGEDFDYAFVSGVFNNLTDDNESFYKRTVKDIFARVRKGFAFNMMSTYVDYYDEGLYYVRPEDVFGYMKTLTPFVTLRNDYQVKPGSIPFEFSIYAYKR